MKLKNILFVALIIAGVGYWLVSSANDETQRSPNSENPGRPFDINELAQTPPMGWNSFDAWDCRIDEKTFLETVDFMHQNLLEFGWEYAVMDYIWWHPEPGHWNTHESNIRRVGHPNVRFKEDGTLLNPQNTRIDSYGRLLPSIERFPSAAEGKEFKEIADYVHNKGMKFGMHIMRGIPRTAVANKMPIKGTEYTADQIAEPWDTCRWNNHMFGIDITKPGAQEYYNSIFELYAEWGVDYIKADDVLFPPFHKGEVLMIKRAIANSGRPMVLSLSPGEAHLGEAEFLKEHANLWRISADFWDEWEHLKRNFFLLDAWSVHSGPGSWPDADMIPFGHISLDDRPHGPDRMSNFTMDEQYTLMNLWCIARSPLMIGSDLLSTPDSIIALFQNEDLLYVNQNSHNGRQVLHDGDLVVWIAEDQHSEDYFLAMFNLGDGSKVMTYDLEWEMIRGDYEATDLWTKESWQVKDEILESNLKPHASVIFRLREMPES